MGTVGGNPVIAVIDAGHFIKSETPGSRDMLGRCRACGQFYPCSEIWEARKALRRATLRYPVAHRGLAETTPPAHLPRDR